MISFAVLDEHVGSRRHVTFRSRPSGVVEEPVDPVHPIVQPYHSRIRFRVPLPSYDPSRPRILLAGRDILIFAARAGPCSLRASLKQNFIQPRAVKRCRHWTRCNETPAQTPFGTLTIPPKRPHDRNFPAYCCSGSAGGLARFISASNRPAIFGWPSRSARSRPSLSASSARATLPLAK